MFAYIPARERVMRWIFVSASLIVAGFVNQAQAQTPVPPAVSAVHAEFLRECNSVGYTGRLRTDFLKTADFNGDGRPDYILDTAKMDCGSYYCGTAGCAIVILMSGAAGYAEGFRENVREWSARRAGSRTVLHAGLHGSECGRAGNDTCYVTFTWRVDGFVKSR